MKIEVQDLSPVKKSLAVEADAEELTRESEAAVRRVARQARVPGFRPGKVPLDVVRKRYAREIEEDVRERLLTRLYSDATRETGLRPLGDPTLEELTHEEGKPFRFKTTFEVLPALEVKDYRGVEVREPEIQVSDEDVDKALEELRQAQTRLVSEEGRNASVGDVVVADVVGTPEQGEVFRRERAFLEVGASDNLPDFNQGIEGAAAGEAREFPVVYPAEYEGKSLAGKRVVFEVKVHEVKRREVPDLDDEFAKDLGDFDNLQALKDRIRSDLEERRRSEARRAVRDAVLDKVLLENPVALPDVLVEDEIRHRLEDLVRMLMLQGMDPRKVELDWKQLRDRQEEPARKAVHARLVLDALAAQEKIEVSDDDVEARLREEAARTGEAYESVVAKIQKAGGLQAVKDQMVRERSLDFLTSVANIRGEE
jgi:trigger factor